MKKLYYNGNIITMNGDEVVQAVLTEDDKIIAVGNSDDLLKLVGDGEKEDLNGKTMLPSFIDAHSHLSSYAMSFLQVPLEECSNFEEISERIKNFIKTNNIAKGSWIMAKGYDHNALKEKKHPLVELLDECAPDNPLVLQHASGHVGVFNSLALSELGIDVNTPSPEGGCIQVENGKLTGYLEENAFISYVKKVPMNDMKDMIGAYQKAQQQYAAHGITTIQEGMMVGQMLPLYQFLYSNNLFNLDVVGYLMPQDAKPFLEAFPQNIKAYQNHFKIGGYKIVLDGSPQGRTAWMRTPYQNEEPPYYGYGTMEDKDVLSAVELAQKDKMQLLAHCNGDAAAAQYLTQIGKAEKESATPLYRPVMIHAQLLGIDQLAKVKQLSIIPSFFIAHVYHWGDVHIENFGKQRASKISPAKSALVHDILFTFHQDTPVIEPDMLETIWCAVNRITKKGVELGSEERISVKEALKAVTINAAYQYGEEDDKGSIKIGKNADFVILDKNPLTVDKMSIKDIKVLQTVKDGKVIYKQTTTE